MIDFIPLLYFSCREKKIRERKQGENLRALQAKEQKAAPVLGTGWTGKISAHLSPGMITVIFRDLFVSEILTLNADILDGNLKSVFAAHSGALFTQ